MLGVTGILVGAVSLASIFMQTVLGYSALRTGVAFLPFALAITVGTVMARHLLARLSPRAVAAPGLVLVAAAAGLLAAAPQTRGTQSTCCPGSSAWAWGWAVSSPPISVSSMAGIPASHAGVASRFLMTGHEIKAALGVAVRSAVAITAGSLATQQAPPRPSRAGSSRPPDWRHCFAVVAMLRMPAARMDSATAGMHMH